jgi:hypothetical protein
MIDPESHQELKRTISERIEADKTILIALRDEARRLRSGVHRIQPRTTTSISLVATDGGPSEVDYSNNGQLRHQSPTIFADEMRKVWLNTADVSLPGATLVIRFGGISDRKAEPLDIVVESLADTGWTVRSIEPAGTASLGKRQAEHFIRTKSDPREEYHIWATLG